MKTEQLSVVIAALLASKLKPEQIASTVATIVQPDAAANAQSSAVPQKMGQNIVVLDRGFVYVGEVVIEGDFLKISNARNIRYWGTKKGLGELREGPRPETKLDEVGEILAPMRALIHLVPCKGF